jgi:hypothetical protein
MAPAPSVRPADAAAMVVPEVVEPEFVSTGNRILDENLQPGSHDWRKDANGVRGADDFRQQVQGYTATTSVNVGESLDFYVTVNPEQEYQITIFRLGGYGGVGARQLMQSPVLHGTSQPEPVLDRATGAISCDWSVAWTLDVPQDWQSGLYQAILTNSQNWRSIIPFVIRDDARAADLCVVLPFTTYAAYNQWPRDGRSGRSLYRGYDIEGLTFDRPASVAPYSHSPLSYEERARKVSFDRPYATEGLPSRFELDHTFVRWVETEGYDVVYATSVDLHEGRIDPARYAGLIFSGHDEYWSRTMRDLAEGAVAGGTSLLFMTANNVYWHIRFDPSTSGQPDRLVVCYREDDPEPDSSGATGRWRDPGCGGAEQPLIGVQYNGIPAKPVPLVVTSSDHWLWAGTDVQDGDLIEDLVAGEADGFMPDYAAVDAPQVLLSASPYQTADGTPFVQNTSVYEAASGAIVFDTGTFNWPIALGSDDAQDKRIQRATANLLDRVLRARVSGPDAGGE